MNRLTLALAAGLVASIVLAAAPRGRPLRVFVVAAEVTERKKVDDATKNELKAKRDAAREARKALEKQLKERYGKKREKWPASKDEELYRAEEAEALAEADYEYRRIDPKGLGDSVKDIVKSIEGKGMAGRKERVAVASSAAEADLVVEVAARRSSKTLPTQFKADRCFVLFNIRAGGEMPAARFARVPASYRFKRFGVYAWKIAGPKRERPFFTFESYNGTTEFGCFGTAANAASIVVDKFIEDNHAVLTGGR